jgi:5-methylcytosine-specific restriction endonuclease McrA
MKYPTRDHVRPKRAGGSLTKRNTLIVCSPCNGEKGDMMLREFYEMLKTKNDPRARNVKRLLERGADPFEYQAIT